MHGLVAAEQKRKDKCERQGKAQGARDTLLHLAVRVCVSFERLDLALEGRQRHFVLHLRRVVLVLEEPRARTYGRNGEQRGARAGRRREEDEG